MSKGNTFENDFLNLILNGVPIANLADNAAASPLGYLYLALHTADPGEGGTQATNEVAFTGYARAPVVRNPSAPAWSVANGVASLNADVDFPKRTDAGASVVATHASIGIAASGATKLLWGGALSSAITITQNTIPRLDTSTTISED